MSGREDTARLVAELRAWPTDPGAVTGLLLRKATDALVAGMEREQALEASLRAAENLAENWRQTGIVEQHAHAETRLRAERADEALAVAVDALREIAANATSWHGDDAAKGRALRVIRETARATLAAIGEGERDTPHSPSEEAPRVDP